MLRQMGRTILERRILVLLAPSSVCFFMQVFVGILPSDGVTDEFHSRCFESDDEQRAMSQEDSVLFIHCFVILCSCCFSLTRWSVLLIKMPHSQFIIPKNPRDTLFFMLMAVLIPTTIVWEFGIVLPSYHRSVSGVVVFHMVAATYIVMNIVGNVLLVMRTDASGRQSFLPSVQRQGKEEDTRYVFGLK